MKNISKIISILKKRYPDAGIALKFKTAMELLVATILSAQCTDKRVNIVTPPLFKKYKTVKAFAIAKPKELEQEIRSTGFYRNKTKNIIGAAKLIVEKFKGKVPDNMKDLLTLPGVARKTANCVLSNWFGKSEGITVDTHVIRVSQRLGLTKNKIPEKIELDLMKILPKNIWGKFSHLIIFHGRNICLARNPKCKECPLKKLCPSFGLFL